jgi:hypothetical protein
VKKAKQYHRRHFFISPEFSLKINKLYGEVGRGSVYTYYSEDTEESEEIIKNISLAIAFLPSIPSSVSSIESIYIDIIIRIMDGE